MKNLTLYIAIALLHCGLSACSQSEPKTSQVASTPGTSYVSPDGRETFELVQGTTQVLLNPQSLSGSEHISEDIVPVADTNQPTVRVLPENLNLYSVHLRKMIGGIGINFEMDKNIGGMRIKNPRSGFGAEMAGLLPDDVIIAADGIRFEDFITEANAVDRIAELIVGKLGSKTRLTVNRDGQEIDFDVLRNFPTLFGYDEIEFEVEQAELGVEIMPVKPLADGLYCYHTIGQGQYFRCFIVGTVEIAKPETTARVEELDQTILGGLEAVECRFPTETDQDVDCGDLVIPENSDNPNGYTIRIHVAVFHPPNPTKPDPVIFLHGGPGGGALAWIAPYYANGYQYLFPDRDFVVYDQRGTGYAEPKLSCASDVDDYAQSIATDLHMSLLAWEATTMDDCREELTNTGIDLAAYTTQANINDLHNIISTMGLDQVNLMGTSYGSKLAMAYVEQYGETDHVRSMILDSVLPPSANIFAERGQVAQSAFQNVFENCAADELCQQEYPELGDQFYALLETLSAEPVNIKFQNPSTGRSQDVVINEYIFIETFYRAMYRADWIPQLPKLITETHAGNYTLFKEALSNIFGLAEGVDRGIYYAVMCADHHPIRDATHAPSEYTSPLIKEFFELTEQSMVDICSRWLIDETLQTQPLEEIIDVPALLLSGAYDPVTPPDWAHLVNRSLENGYLVEFPTSAHGVLGGSPCAQMVVADFVKNPDEPEHICLLELPTIEFELP